MRFKIVFIIVCFPKLFHKQNSQNRLRISGYCWRFVIEKQLAQAKFAEIAHYDNRMFAESEEFTYLGPGPKVRFSRREMTLFQKWFVTGRFAAGGEIGHFATLRCFVCGNPTPTPSKGCCDIGSCLVVSPSGSLLACLYLSRLPRISKQQNINHTDILSDLFIYWYV